MSAAAKSCAFVLVAGCLVSLGLAACASGPRARFSDAIGQGDVPAALARYDEVRRDDGDDLDLLAHLATLVLERAAADEVATVREAALTQLALAGTAGTPVLRRIAKRARTDAVRARALELLAERGDGRALDELYALLDSETASARAAALTAVDPHDEPARLVAALRDASPLIRRAAAKALGPIAAHDEVRDALVVVGRVDPEANVRRAAVTALASAGDAAFEGLRDRLSDPDPSVRHAAVSALYRASPERARIALTPLLAQPPNPASVDAARVLAGKGATLEARAYLRAALTAGVPSIRAQSGIALATLRGDAGLDAAIVQALRAEADATAKLSLAIALLARERFTTEARRALRDLAKGDGMPAVQAASLLAARGDTGARYVDRLARSAASPDVPPLVARVAARALARDARAPERARVLLAHRDPLLRVAAAGGILALSADE